MEYRVFEPVYLQDFVKCYWTIQNSPTEERVRQRIVPDGCMEMIFHYANGFKQYRNDGSSILQPMSFVFGQITEPLEIEPIDVVDSFAVRFQPNGFMPFAFIPLAEMNNRAVPLSEVFGKPGKKFEIEMLRISDNNKRIACTEAFLGKILAAKETKDRVASISVDVLMQIDGQLTVDELSKRVHMSRRQLERNFITSIGLSPKQYSKIVRLQHTLLKLTKKKYTSLSALSYESGYFDHAHFIREFREFTGVSPSKFYEGNLELSFLFSGYD